MRVTEMVLALRDTRKSDRLSGGVLTEMVNKLEG